MGPPEMWDGDTLCLTLERSIGASWSSATWALEGEWARLRGLVLERHVKTWQPSARNFARLASGFGHLLPRIRPSSPTNTCRAASAFASIFFARSINCSVCDAFLRWWDCCLTSGLTECFPPRPSSPPRRFHCLQPGDPRRCGGAGHVGCSSRTTWDCSDALVLARGNVCLLERLTCCTPRETCADSASATMLLVVVGHEWIATDHLAPRPRSISCESWIAVASTKTRGGAKERTLWSQHV